jgi:hypothetical protein
MEHPEPLEKGIVALRNIDNDSYLYMLNRKNPIPLISLAKQHGYRVLSHEKSSGEWHILITKNPEQELGEYLDV